MKTVINDRGFSRTLSLIQNATDISTVKSLVDLMVAFYCETWEKAKKDRNKRYRTSEVEVTKAYLEKTAKTRKEQAAKRYQKYKNDPKRWKEMQTITAAYLERNGHKRHQQRRRYLERPETRKRVNNWANARNKNPRIRIRGKLSQRINNTIGAKRKSASTIQLLGCSYQAFLDHLAAHFEPGMTLDNHGFWKRGEPMKWHIDHIIPCSAYDLTDPAEQRKCFNWRNMRPTWANENIAKHDDLVPELIERFAIDHLLPKGHALLTQ